MDSIFSQSVMYLNIYISLSLQQPKYFFLFSGAVMTLYEQKHGIGRDICSYNSVSITLFRDVSTTREGLQCVCGVGEFTKLGLCFS